jgi:hypothetical protein
MKRTLLFFLLLIPTVTLGGELETKKDVSDFSKTVMETVSAKGVEAGLLALKPYIIVADSEFDMMLEDYRIQAPAIERRYGKTIGYEFISEEVVGESLMEIMYLQKYEKHVALWHFCFYKPNDKWLLATYYATESIKEIFDYTAPQKK